ncbi:MAG: hypothetical protein JSV24_11700 [Bacteroidales bacterium]|nr:MAG: hypothetical protein JSV24_11700 [Bacteroidales bacterium]
MIQSFLPSFEQTLILKKQAYRKQVQNNKEYHKTLKKIRLYISHFIQVVNLAIIRGEIPPSTRKFYNLEETDKNLPRLQTESQVIRIGQNLIEGEAKRITKGLAPITNPTIAVVKVRYEQFLDAYNFQKTLQKRNHLTLEKLADMRKKADRIILQVWNDVEETYKDLPEELRRNKAVDYGLIYVFRKNELDNINLFETGKKEIG